MFMNISCKFEKASYNIFSFVNAVMVKSLYTLRHRHDKAKSILSGGYNNHKYSNLLSK